MAAGVAFAILAAAIVYFALSNRITLLDHSSPASAAARRNPGRTGRTGRTGQSGRAAPQATVRLSAEGLPLGRPPMPLALANPQSDPLHLGFREPPRAGLLIDLDSGRVLWQRNALTRLRIASLTKMMTALLTVKAAPANAPVLITKQAEETSGSKVGVLPLGHHVRLETLLYGLLLPSGNDAAVALAQHVAGTVHRFVLDMNAEAARLGMGCTRYSSPSGYYNTHNYSCAADLAELAREDLLQPRIARVTRSRSAILPFPIKGGKLYLYNNNPLLIYGYPGITGLKTGQTIEAGRCLVATAERHGVRLAVVLLHSPAPGVQARDLLDDAFRNVYHQRPVAEPPLPPNA
jgi:D-alanyl-D-alanine carboxypeptidase (penicillin-binding protein 5/6)